jgi:putative endonuclease
MKPKANATQGVSRCTGAEAEERAVGFLKGLGYRVIDRNFHSRSGEIDIIASDGETLVFVEVRSRNTASFGSAGETVDFKRREKIRRTALAYAQIKAFDGPMRFDVIAIDSGHIDHIPSAFDG